MIEYRLKNDHFVIKDDDGFSGFSIYDIQGIYPDEGMVTFHLTNGKEWEYNAGTPEEAVKNIRRYSQTSLQPILTITPRTT